MIFNELSVYLSRGKIDELTKEIVTNLFQIALFPSGDEYTKTKIVLYDKFCSFAIPSK